MFRMQLWTMERGSVVSCEKLPFIRIQKRTQTKRRGIDRRKRYRRKIGGQGGTFYQERDIGSQGRKKEDCPIEKNVLYCRYGKTIELKAATPLFFGGCYKCPPDERKEGDNMNVTYSDLFQFCIFVVALVGLCYTIFTGRKQPPTIHGS